MQTLSAIVDSTHEVECDIDVVWREVVATVAGIVVHSVTGLSGWTAAAVESTGLSWFDIVDHSTGGCQSQNNMTQHYQQEGEKTDYDHDSAIALRLVSPTTSS
jgi:hypothetical protein